MNPWFKFYGSEYLSDPKIGSLTPQERSCWVTMMCLSSSSSIPGVIEYLTVEVLLEKSGIDFDPYHPEEWDACISILSKFERMNMIKINDNGNIEIINWHKRQDSAMTVTERVRKYRLKSKINQDYVTNVTNGNENANDRVEKSRIEKNREEKKEERESASISYLSNIPENDLNEFLERFIATDREIKNKAESLKLYCESRGKKYKNYKAFLLNALKADFKEKNNQNNKYKNL